MYMRIQSSKFRSELEPLVTVKATDLLEKSKVGRKERQTQIAKDHQGLRVSGSHDEKTPRKLRK